MRNRAENKILEKIIKSQLNFRQEVFQVGISTRPKEGKDLNIYIDFACPEGISDCWDDYTRERGRVDKFVKEKISEIREKFFSLGVVLSHTEMVLTSHLPPICLDRWVDSSCTQKVPLTNEEIDSWLEELEKGGNNALIQMIEREKKLVQAGYFRWVGIFPGCTEGWESLRWASIRIACKGFITYEVFRKLTA